MTKIPLYYLNTSDIVMKSVEPIMSNSVKWKTIDRISFTVVDVRLGLKQFGVALVSMQKTEYENLDS